MTLAAGAATPVLLAAPGAASPHRRQVPPGPDPARPGAAGVAPARAVVGDTALTEVPLTPAVAGPTDISDPVDGVRAFEVSHTEPFSMVAVAWNGDAAVHPVVRARTPDGAWGEWIELDEAHVPPSAARGSTRNGTEIAFVGETTAAQIVLRRHPWGGETVDVAEVPGLAAVLVRPSAAPVRAQLSDITEPVEAEPVPVETEPVPAAAAPEPDLAPVDVAAALPARPRVLSRAQWGADESVRCQRPTYNDSLGGVVIHHTAGTNNYTPWEGPQIVRGIYAYHARTLGWCDIGYHALVDKYGNIYEGRFGGLDRPVEGAHTGGFNENTAGISMIGNFTSVAPTPAQLNAVGRLVGWRLAVANRSNPRGSQPTLTAKGSTVMYSEGTRYTWIPRGQAVTVPMVFAHRDVGLTECPGNVGYRSMDRIRDIAAAHMATARVTEEQPLRR